MCQGLVGFTISNISHVRIRGMVFVSCGKSVIFHVSGTKLWTLYAISITDVQHDAEIANCTFKNSVHAALRVNNSKLILRGNNSFTNNCQSKRWLDVCHKQPDNDTVCFCMGGGIVANFSNLSFTGSNS